MKKWQFKIDTGLWLAVGVGYDWNQYSKEITIILPFISISYFKFI